VCGWATDKVMMCRKCHTFSAFCQQQLFQVFKQKFVSSAARDGIQWSRAYVIMTTTTTEGRKQLAMIAGGRRSGKQP